MTDVTNLPDALTQKMKELREDILPAYRSLLEMPNVIVAPQIAWMNEQLTLAEQALAEQDVIAMMRVYDEIKDLKV